MGLFGFVFGFVFHLCMVQEVSCANDNSPHFTSAMTVTVSEDFNLIDLLMTLSADDADDGVDGEWSISVVDDPDQHVMVTPEGEMYLMKSLDYETNTSHVIGVKVTDKGQPPRSSEGQVTIIVTNARDALPWCKKQTYVFGITENNRHQIAKFYHGECADPEEGNRDYSTLAHIRGKWPDTDAFDLNFWGKLKTVKNLDYEKDPTQYILAIRIQTRGDRPYRSITITAIVNIIDVDDEMVSWPGGNRFNMSFPEDAAPYTSLTRLTANDDVWRVRYGITTQPVPYSFVITDDGDLYATKPFDREHMETLELVIYAQDHKGKRPIVPAYVTITITDANDNPPVFGQFYYLVTINEMTDYRATPLASLTATDRDIGANAEISYSMVAIGGDPSAAFSIDPQTGDVHSSGNYVRSKYTFTVTARDNGTPSQHATVTLEVVVTPANRFDPQFKESTYVIDVDEDTGVGTTVLTVTATDEDFGVDGVVWYTINANVSEFVIFPESGDLMLIAPLDRETQSQYIFVVTATDRSLTYKRNNTATVTVNVGDINDNRPECTVNSVVLLVEPLNIGDPVAESTCHDRDEGVNADLLYSFLSGNDNDVFVIDVESGAITLQKLPTLSRYLLACEAIDKGIPPLKKPYSVEVKVTAKPYISNLPNTSYIDETESIALLWYDVDGFGYPGPVKYDIVSGDEEGVFAIDFTTGEIYNIKPIHVEDQVKFELNISITDITSLKSSTELFTIHVADVNDNTPTFDKSYYIRNILENVADGHLVITITATDKDLSSTNNEITYSLVTDGSGKFSIDQSGKITVTGQLDRETSSSHEVRVQAKDNGTPSLSSVVTLFVVVVEFNEHPPIYSVASGVYELAVSEYTAIATVILDINATDADGSVLTYSITSGNDGAIFSLDETNGKLYLLKELDREIVDTYVLDIVVENKYDEQATGKVTINVSDENDNDPLCRDETVYFENMAALIKAENVVATVACSDSDINDNGELVYSIYSGNVGNHFYMNNNEVKISPGMDTSQINYYSLVVEVTDKGNPARIKSVIVNIKIDQDRPMPKYITDSTSITIPEDYIVGNLLYNCEATFESATEGVNGTLSYSIDSGDDAGQFHLSPETGKLFLTRRLDFESGTNEYSLMLKAVDKVNPTLFDVLQLDMTVTDVNDNYPKFPSSITDTDVDYVPDKAHVILTWQATDLDSGDNGKVEYSISGNQEFSINNESGVITVSGNLNPKEGEVYLLTVTANDKGIPTRQSTSVVYATIVDNSNHAPTFSEQVYYISVREDVGNDVVFIISAIDQDSGVNGMVEYGITGGNVGNVVQVNPQNGDVSVNGALDRETVAEYNISISATDFGTPPLTADATLNIIVLDVNDNTPVFQNTPYDTTVIHATPPLSPIFNVVATDLDIGFSSQLSYRILPSGNENRLFKIDPFTGIVKTTTLLSSNFGRHELVVECADYGNPSRSAQVPLVITVTRSGAVPQFSSPSTSVSVSEGELPGFLVLDANATAAGSVEGDSGSLVYKLTGDDTNTFSVDPRNGKITLNAILNRDTGAASYDIAVQATDKYDESQVHSMNIKIDVLDTNNNKPLFTNTSYLADVKHEESQGTFVVRVEATDLDSGDNAVVKYTTLTGDGADDFTLDRDTGELAVNISPDIYIRPFYVLKVTARDEGTPPLESSLYIYITVIAPGNTRPYFTNNVFEVYVKEDMSVDDTVFALTAIDRDFGDSGILSYAIISGNDDNTFSINSTSGVITLEISLDREVKSKYELEVKATDSGTLPLDASTLVAIHVMDVNDHYPIFEGMPYEINVDTETPVATLIGSVSASDGDLANNGMVTYIILEGNNDSIFNVHSFNGEIKTSMPLIGKAGTYKLLVSGTDTGIVGKSTNVTININVAESTDNRPPIFSQDIYEVSVMENNDIDIVVFQAVATDRDVGNRGIISYTLLTTNNGSGIFTINSTTGDVTVAAELDREDKDMYEIVITATDSGNIPTSSSITLNVNVIDDNDNRPKFEINRFKETIHPFLPDGTEIVLLNATDGDIGENSKIFYSLTGDAGPFSVDAVSGSLKTVGDLRSNTGQYTVVVTATDSGYPSKSADALIEVEILSEVPDQQFEVEENLPPGTSLGFLETTVTGDLTYAIESGTGVGKLEIKPNGELVTSKKLDAEDMAELVLEVLITNSEDPPDSQHRLLAIKVNDIDDNFPKFSRGSYTANIVERQAPDSVVLNFAANDRDVSQSRHILTYSMSPPEIEQFFYLDTARRQVKIKEPPIYKNQSQYTFKLHVIDTEDPPNTDEADVTINIEEAPRVSPSSDQCSKSVYVTHDVPFNVAKGTVVYTLTYKTFEMELFQVINIKYVTLQGQDAPFQIGETNGNIVCSNTDLMYKNSRYLFWVVAQAYTVDVGEIGAVAMVRLDTFIPNDHVVIIRHGRSKADMELAITDYTTKLSNLASAVVKVWQTTMAGIARRKRQVATTTESYTYIYGVKNPSSEQLTGLETTKVFLTQSELKAALPLSTIQSDPFTEYVIRDVIPYNQPEVEESWAETTTGISVITVIVLTVVIIIVFIVVYCWCTIPRQHERSESAESLEKSDEMALDSGGSPFMTSSGKNPMLPYYHRVPSPKPHRTVTVDGVVYDGRALDSDSGTAYLFNTSTGERRYVTEDELDVYLAQGLPYKVPPCIMPQRGQQIWSTSLRSQNKSPNDGSDSENERLENELNSKDDPIYEYFKPLAKDANRLERTCSYIDIRETGDSGNRNDHPEESLQPPIRQSRSLSPAKGHGRTFRGLKHFWNTGRTRKKSQVIKVQNDRDGIIPEPPPNPSNSIEQRERSLFEGQNSPSIPRIVVSRSNSHVIKPTSSPRLRSRVAPASQSFSPKMWKATDNNIDRSVESQTDSAYSSVGDGLV